MPSCHPSCNTTSQTPSTSAPSCPHYCIPPVTVEKPSCPHSCNPAVMMQQQDSGPTKEKGIQVLPRRTQGCQVGGRSEMQQLQDSFQLESKLPRVLIATDTYEGEIPTVVVCDNMKKAANNCPPCDLQEKLNQKCRAVNCLKNKVTRLHEQMKCALDMNVKLHQQMDELTNQQNSCPYSCDKPVRAYSMNISPPPKNSNDCAACCQTKPKCPAEEIQTCCPPKPKCPAKAMQGCGVCPTCTKKEEQCTQLPPCAIQVLIDRLNNLLEPKKPEGCCGPCNIFKKPEPCPGPCHEPVVCPPPPPPISAELDELLDACIGKCNVFREQLKPEESSNKNGNNGTKTDPSSCAGPCNTQGLKDKIDYLSQSVPAAYDNLHNMLNDTYFTPAERDSDEPKKSKCGGPCNLQGLSDKINAITEECPAALEKVKNNINKCIIPQRADRPSDVFQYSSIHKNNNGGSRPMSCPLTCANNSKRLSSTIDEIEQQLNCLNQQLCAAQEENEKYEQQQEFIRCIKRSQLTNKPKSDNSCPPCCKPPSSQKALPPCKPRPTALPPCPPRPALPPCPPRPALPPCQMPPEKPKSSCCCSK